ncbi:hypothetical protein DPX39_090033200 [Trypanosoma brucei equiperdum]|uniref:Uncharacterized protein n=1 Tax=Trypanosoma brucei equiperdum TaxID=630700 RepID=A0A3L6L3G6_9TRYP|nr:hypothetical protein DPX39_090033200 [Trypanosoma brucei equiperdum]
MHIWSEKFKDPTKSILANIGFKGSHESASAAHQRTGAADKADASSNGSGEGVACPEVETGWTSFQPHKASAIGPYGAL